MQWGNGTVTAPAVRRTLERVIVLDTETTGLLPYDRLVSLAAIRFEGGSMREHIYRVYDPRKDSHPRAAEVHGWDDWTLRFQDLFADDAEEIREWFSWADRLVMHNAEFDMRYVARELRKAEVAPLEVGTLCTMQQARQRWAGSAKLDDCLNRIGLARKGRVHGAYEDALLTAHLYFHLDGKGLGVSLPAQWPAPTNLRPAPARPAGELPRRSPKKPGRRPLRKAPAHEPNRTAEITSRAQDGLLILRHIAEAGHTNIDAQVDFIEHYIVHALSTMNVEADPELIQSLCSYALGLPGSESEAVAATLRLAAHEIDIQALGPLIINLVKADGATTDEEARVVRQFIATIRDERQRGTVAPPTPTAPIRKSSLPDQPDENAIVAAMALAERMASSPVVDRRTAKRGPFAGPDPLDFLRRPDAEEYLRSIENDLAAQVHIVARSFEFYLVTGEIPAPHYAHRTCVILRRFGRHAEEAAFLKEWCRHFPSGNGRTYELLVERARKLGAMT